MDPEINALPEIITEGWLNKQKQLQKTLLLYWSYRDELSVEDSLVVRVKVYLYPPACKQGS